MKHKPLFMFAILPLSLTSCVSGIHHNISEYILETEYSSNYRILQLTDTHLSDKDDQDKHFAFMDLTIQEANPDMIVVTGDLFTFASRGTAERFFKFLDSYNVPWTVTFGNHDEQCYFSVDWLTSLLNNYGNNCLFKDIQDDNVNGNANFAINLMQGNSIFEQIIIMDSNRYYFGSYFGYDYFKADQIAWYERLVDHTKEQNGGTTVESLMFYHIPLPEINEAWDKANDGSGEATLKFGEKGEKSCPPEENSGFFNIIVEKGSTKAMLFGHDHVNNFIVNYKGVDFAYGVKSTDRIYFQDSLLGGRVVVIHDDHSLTYEDFYHTYEEL